MTPERFREAEAIFKAACEFPPEERLGYAERSCGSDRELLNRVRRLLAHDALPAEAFQSPAAQAVRDYADSLAESAGALPERIGSYRVIKLLGEGGFGTVYLAEQQHPRRQVAVKVLRANLASSTLLKRFQYEAQVLARLQHPGIAQIYEAGTAVDADGAEAYLAMEYVEGAPLDAYAAAHRLDARARLKLFARVCDAVQYAHQKGVIHRDLKPANILVVCDDDGGTKGSRDRGTEGNGTPPVPAPKVLDFGVARITDPEAQTMTLATSRGQLIGTLPYMSPEQAACDPDEIDTRSDVYGLGVILYELLSGRLPYELGDCAVLEAVRRIREQPAARLGATVRALRGEIETIVHRALEKDRDRRYQSAADLAADIRRHLAGEPIDARRDSLTYVLKKSLRRHRLATGFAVTVVLLLTASSVALSILYKRAETQAAVAERVADFMSQTLAGAGPAVARGRDTMMLREMMDAAARRIERGELARAPEAELRLRLTLGGTYRQLAGYESAEQLLAPAVDSARTIYGDNHVQVAHALFQYGRLLKDRGRGAEALDRVQEALETYQRLSPVNESDVIRALSAVASTLEVLGRAPEALPKFEAALDMARRLHAGDHEEVALALNNLGGCLEALGRTPEALPIFQASLEMKQRLYSGDHPEVASSLNNLAYSLRTLGRFAEARPMYESALSMQERLFGGDHPEVAGTLSNLAACLLAEGRPADALPKLEAALEMRRRVFKGDHPDVARGLNNIGGCLRSMGRPGDALPKLQECLDLWRRLVPGDHSDVAMALSNVASCLNALGQPAEALPKFEAALAMWQRLFPEDHPDIGRGLNNVASCLQTLGRLEEALPKFEKALDIHERLFKGDHPNVARLLDNLAGCLQAMNRPSEAAPRYEAALEMRKRLLPPDHTEVRISEAGLGIALLEMDRLDEAEALLVPSCADLSARPNAPAKHRRRAIEALAKLYDRRHDADPDQGYAEKAAEWRARLDAAAP